MARKCLKQENQWIVDLLKEKLSNFTGANTHKRVYKTAIQNIAKCPFIIKNEYVAKEVDGIGDKFAKIIKQKLISRGEYVDRIQEEARHNARKEIELKQKTPKKKSKPKKSNASQPYIPRVGTGPYAILLWLYEQSSYYNTNTATKEDIIEGAQKYATASFTDPISNNRFNHTAYTAWNTKKLEDNKYIIRDRKGGGGLHRFTLTLEGKSVGELMYNIKYQLEIPEKWQNYYQNKNKQRQSNKNQKEKKFKCDHCGKGYQQKKSYEKHLETHSNSNTNNDNHTNHNNSRKRKRTEIMTENDYEPSPNSNSNSYNQSFPASNPAKRQRICSSMNPIMNDGRILPIQIGNDMFQLKLIYDTSEETHRGSRERAKLETQFKKYKDITAETYRLPIGDFIWILETFDGNKKWIYPVMIERKRMDDLVASIKDKRYNEQKWRMKRNLKGFTFVYLIEKKQIEEYQQKMMKQALNGTEVRDGFLIYHTEGLMESIKALSSWTKIIYNQIIMKLKEKQWNINYEFFRDEGCIDFDIFLKNKENHKNTMTAKVLFGRQLMSIPGVTDLIASRIITVYPTFRYLINGWRECANKEEQKLLLFNKIDASCFESHRDVDTGKVALDQDLLNVVKAIDKKELKPVNKKLSEKIWRSFYVTSSE